MAETSGTWTSADLLGVFVYRNVQDPTSTGITNNSADGTGAIITYPALTPVTYPAALGTGWYVACGMHKSATNVGIAPAGMGNIATNGSVGVHDTGGPVSTNWPSTNVTVNATDRWVSFVLQMAANGTVSRVGAGVASGVSTIAIPAGHQIGDLMVIVSVRWGAGGTGVPVGWASIGSVSTPTATYTGGWKIVASPDTTGGRLEAWGSLAH